MKYLLIFLLKTAWVILACCVILFNRLVGLLYHFGQHMWDFKRHTPGPASPLKSVYVGFPQSEHMIFWKWPSAMDFIKRCNNFDIIFDNGTIITAQERKEMDDRIDKLFNHKP